MTNQCHEAVTGFASPRSVRRETFASRLLKAIMWAESAIERHRQRQALRSMDDRMLRDLGVTPADVDHEANKPAWRA